MWGCRPVTAAFIIRSPLVLKWFLFSSSRRPMEAWILYNPDFLCVRSSALRVGWKTIDSKVPTAAGDEISSAARRHVEKNNRLTEAFISQERLIFFVDDLNLRWNLQLVSDLKEQFTQKGKVQSLSAPPRRADGFWWFCPLCVFISWHDPDVKYGSQVSWDLFSVIVLNNSEVIYLSIYISCSSFLYSNCTFCQSTRLWRGVRSFPRQR